MTDIRYLRVLKEKVRLFKKKSIVFKIDYVLVSISLVIRLVFTISYLKTTIIDRYLKGIEGSSEIIR